jgi:hypothetical protein
MTDMAGRWTRAVRFQALGAVCALVLIGCGGEGATTTSGDTATTAAPAQGKGRPVRGTLAFDIAANCTHSVSDGKDYLTVACPGSVSRLDPASGKARWTFNDPTWTKIDRIKLGGEVVVLLVRVMVPASGLTPAQEGMQVVAVADGKRLWATELFPTSVPPHFATTADITVVLQRGTDARVVVEASLIAYETKSGRQRFRPGVDKAQCYKFDKAMILKDSVAGCGQRFSLGDGSALPYKVPNFTTLAEGDPGSDLAAAFGEGNQGDNGFTIFRADGTPLGKASGTFLGFASGGVVQKNSDSNGRVGSVSALNPDGSRRWEQPLTLADRGIFNDVSFANGSAWVRNTSNELIGIDGATGKAASPLPVSGVGLGVTAKVVATTANVVVVSTGREGDSPSLKAVAL